MKVNPIRVGLVVGAVTGLWHAGWSALVAMGAAQWLIDLILYLHFLKIAVTVEAFDISRAAMLVGLTSALGFVFGLLAGWIWNALHSAQAKA